MTTMPHELLHDVTALVLLSTGIPVLFLAWRAYRSRPRRSPLTAVGGARPTLFALLTAGLSFGSLVLAGLAFRAAAVDATLLTVAAAALGAFALRAARSARFNGVVTIPLVGLIGIAALLAVAGPQPTIEHHVHAETSRNAR